MLPLEVCAQYVDLPEKKLYELLRDCSLHAYQVGREHRIPDEALEESGGGERIAATNTEDADLAPPLFAPNFRRGTRY